MSLFRKHGPLHRLTMLGGAVILFSMSYYIGNKYIGKGHPANISAVQFKQAIELPLDKFVDHNNEPVKPQIQGHWNLLVFSDLSASADMRLANLLHRVRNRLAEWPKLQNQLMMLFLSQSPADQSAEQIKEKLSPYGINFMGISGPTEQVRVIFSAFGAEQTSDSAYANASPIYLINPDGKAIALFNDKQKAAVIAEDLKLISDTY